MRRVLARQTIPCRAYGFKCRDSDSPDNQTHTTVRPHPWLTNCGTGSRISGSTGDDNISLPDPRSSASLPRTTTSGELARTTRPARRSVLSTMHDPRQTTTNHPTSRTTTSENIFCLNAAPEQHGTGTPDTPEPTVSACYQANHGPSQMAHVGGGMSPPSPASLHSAGNGRNLSIDFLHVAGRSVEEVAGR